MRQKKYNFKKHEDHCCREFYDLYYRQRSGEYRGLRSCHHYGEIRNGIAATSGQILIAQDRISLRIYCNDEDSRSGQHQQDVYNDALVDMRYFPQPVANDRISLYYFWPSVVNWLGIRERDARTAGLDEAHEFPEFNAEERNSILYIWSGIIYGLGNHYREGGPNGVRNGGRYINLNGGQNADQPGGRNGERHGGRRGRRNGGVYQAEARRRPHFIGQERNSIIHIWSCLLSWLVHFHQDPRNDGTDVVREFLLLTAEDRAPISHFWSHEYYWSGHHHRPARDNRSVNAGQFSSRTYLIADDLSAVVFWRGATSQVIRVDCPRFRTITYTSLILNTTNPEI